MVSGPILANQRPARQARRRQLLGSGLTVSMAVALLTILRPPLLAGLEDRIYDELTRQRERPYVSRRVVLVDVDEDSLARFGRWPWPRALLARLVNRISEQGALSVGVDMVLADPEATGETPPALGASADRSGAKVTAAPQSLSAGDEALTQVLGLGPFVLGYELCFQANPPACAGDELPHPLQVATVGVSGSRAPVFWRALGAVAPLAKFAGTASGAGFLNASPDQDGVMRRVPLLAEYRGRLYPSLALATWMRAVNATQAILRTSPEGLQTLELRGLRVPLDSRGNLLLRYSGGGNAFPRVSAGELLSGKTPARALAGKIVFLGSSAAGLRESVTTPLASVVPGVEIHAILADNLLRGDFVAHPRWAGSVELAAVVILGLGFTGTLMAAGPASSVLLLGIVTAGLWFGSGWLLGAHGLFVSPFFPLLTLGVVSAVVTTVRLATELRRADQRTRDLAVTQDFMMESLASLVEIRDNETGAHILRTERYLRILGDALRRNPKFAASLTAENVEFMSRLAQVHDIGKVGVPDCLLQKPGKLTEEELAEVQKHAGYGRAAIERAEKRVGVGGDALLVLAKQIVYCHHERWDGTGYPEGLSGEKIPIAGRLMALVDVYDALTTRRVYKAPLPHAEAVRIIFEGKGTQFDPDVVDAFLGVEGEWRKISRLITDGGGREEDLI